MAIERAALKRLERLDPPVRVEAERVIGALATDPRPRGCKALKGAMKGHYRLRFGPRAGWRIIYRIDDRTIVVTVVNVDTRGDIY